MSHNHIPFSKECTSLKGAGRSRPHRKVPHPDDSKLGHPAHFDLVRTSGEKPSTVLPGGVYAFPVPQSISVAILAQAFGSSSQ